jgi:flagellin-specific chaperone FliS
MTKKQAKKPYWEMNTQELAEATAEFDEEFVIDKCVPLTPEMRARWEKAKRKRPSSKNGAGEQLVSVKIEKDLLTRSDALAKKLAISRACLIARGLKAVLAAEGEI